MGLPVHPHLVSLKDMIQRNEELHKSSISRSLRNKVMEAQATKMRCHKGTKERVFSCRKNGVLRSRRPRRVLTKRRTSLEGYNRRGAAARKGIERRVRTLKKLIPNSTESMGLEGLFREAADYILSLQMRVKVMQTMVQVITGSDDE